VSFSVREAGVSVVVSVWVDVAAQTGPADMFEANKNFDVCSSFKLLGNIDKEGFWSDIVTRSSTRLAWERLDR
jgi:hypothetical protein